MYWYFLLSWSLVFGYNIFNMGFKEAKHIVSLTCTCDIQHSFFFGINFSVFLVVDWIYVQYLFFVISGFVVNWVYVQYILHHWFVGYLLVLGAPPLPSSSGAEAPPLPFVVGTVQFSAAPSPVPVCVTLRP